MALHEHTVRNDRLEEQLDLATRLGEYRIPTVMTLPLAQIKRELRAQVEAWRDAKQMVMDQHTEGEWQDPKAPGEGEWQELKAPGEKRKFVPDPVYLLDDEGKRKFKLDKNGKETTEFAIAQGKIQLKNSVMYQRELRDMERESTTFKVPHISWPQLEGTLKTLEPNIAEGLMEYFDDKPKPETEDSKPAPRKRSAEKTAAT